jgi:hypothetical protein
MEFPKLPDKVKALTTFLDYLIGVGHENVLITKL